MFLRIDYMNYLIAGGAGFIGSHMVKRLLKEGHRVTVVDNLCTGSEDNIKKFLKIPNFKFVNADICSYDDSEKYDRIVNLACPASPVHYQANPIQTMLTNVQGTYNLLGMAYLKGARFLQASTSEVYGDPSVHPQPEEYLGNVNCYGPRSCYDEGKRAAESLVYDFQRVVQLDARIVRIFNTYGPNMAINDGRVVSNFIVQALKGDKITIYGDGQQTRSFCYVEDTVDGILKVLEGDYNKPVNVGNPDEYTMNQIAETILKITGSKSGIAYFTLPEDDPKQRKPDISKIYQKYGWEPTITLDFGLNYTVKYFKRVVKLLPPKEVL
jgi:UDP-glucuronate decarboxylase